MTDTNPQSSMTLPEILARLEKMEILQRDAAASVGGQVAYLRESDASHFAATAASYALDALALSEARKALALQEGLVTGLEVLRPHCSPNVEHTNQCNGGEDEGPCDCEAICPRDVVDALLEQLRPTPPPQEP